MDLPEITRAKIAQRLSFEKRRLSAKAREVIESKKGSEIDAKLCSYKRYLYRTNGRFEADYPPEWNHHNLPFASGARVAAVVHVFYPDLVPEIVAGLDSIPVPLDVYVTNASGQGLAEDTFKVGSVQNVAILPVRNQGRDIAPLLYVVNAGYLDPYDLVLKLHTKKSPWREAHGELEGTGEQWRDSLLTSLVGSSAGVEEILSAFATDPRLGAVGAPGTILGPEFWGGDEALVGELGRRLGLQFPSDSLKFVAGSMYWIRGFLLQGLRGLNMHFHEFEDEEGQVDGTTAHAVERLIGLLTEEAGLSSVETGSLPAITSRTSGDPTGDWRRFLPTTALTPAARYIPFYLPQFHPSAVNDRWWGRGFTEWTNVAQGRPIFDGHVQPLVPGELGFYDLRMDSVRERQLELEQYAGIAGLMYYYYWFSGERVLNLPIERLAGSDLEQPFCIMWANENWTRAWDGNESDVLLSQRYDEVPAEDFIDDVMEFLADPRYMRIDGAAIIAVYRPGQMADFRRVSDTWRDRARAAGVGELCLLSVDVTKSFDGIEVEALGEHGLDGHLGFPPHGVEWPRATRDEANPNHQFHGHLISYRKMSQVAVGKALEIDDSGYPGVMVNFDNTARKKWRADVWYGSNPYTFSRWLRDVTEAFYTRPPEQRVIFINAWNEWAESAVLEPTQRWGMTYLQAVRNVAFS